MKPNALASRAVPPAFSPVTHSSLLRGALLMLAALVVWDASGADLATARWFGDADGFPLRRHWLLDTVLHEGGRIAAWAVALLLCVGVWWPVGPLRRIDSVRRMQLAFGTLAAVFVVSLLKGFSLTSCPADLAMFGRTARYVSHWAWPRLPDGGGGHCFPAGHASAGFALLNGYFAFRHDAPGIARRWLAAALAVGVLFGLAQQVRGMHFMSHTLWTAWICWCVALAIDGLVTIRRRPEGGGR